MKTLTKSHFNRRLLLIDLICIILGFFYFLFFTNKGIVLSDEGYYVHYAERIFKGQIAYKDFVLQYSPGYFYLLALLYKIFGVQLLVGRYLSLAFCLLIQIAVLFLLRLYKINSTKIHILVLLTLISLGYPLLHVPIVVWSCVFIAVLLQIFYLLWLLGKKNTLFLTILGFLLALQLFFKQNLGLVFFFIINFLVLMTAGKGFGLKLKSLFLMNLVWAITTGFWIYLFFIYTQNLAGLQTLFAYSKQFVDTYKFTYPPLTYLIQPTGFFKLLPYYFPIIYLMILIWMSIRDKIAWEKLSFSLIALTGFFATVYPASDLLHVYPFLGIVLVSSLVYFYKRKGFTIVMLLLVVFILMGFYLTFFTKSYRYEGLFLNQITPLDFPKTKGIVVDMADPSRSSLYPLNKFITMHTKKNDYIFVYPFSPMIYFILDRQNPNGIVQFVLLEAPSSLYSEKKVISEMKQKKVRYIITVGPYKYNRKISQFIQKQKEVYRTGPYNVFEIKY